MKSWINDEPAGCKFKDARLGTRFRSLLERMSDGIGGSIPLVCQGWVATKAAYRFLSNDSVDETSILGCHFQSTRERFAATDGPILVLQDTTEFSYQRERPHLIGKPHKTNSGRDQQGRLRRHTVCGILMHSSPAITTDGLPLGLAAIKFCNVIITSRRLRKRSVPDIWQTTALVTSSFSG